MEGVEHGQPPLVLAHGTLGHDLRAGLDAGYVPPGEHQCHRPGPVGQCAAQDLRALPGLYLDGSYASCDPGLLPPVDLANGDSAFYR